ncbi:MAG TPA: DUF4097 family beta strand repeat-containing protein [Thermoanaerobaculaceae bacterium]|nr:DUF4097 family beta strand repeat-containing protein [Thermoanaerobaculaceae bacterium]
MRRLPVVLVLAVLAPTLACVRRPLPTDVHQAQTFPAAPGKLVKVDLRSLDVNVRIVDGATIRATADLEARSSSRSAARRWIERNTPVFNDSTSTLEVRQPSREHTVIIFGFMHNKGEVGLEVPPSCRIEIRTTSGDVSIQGDQPASGAVRVTTTSGDVTVVGGARELVVNTTSGDVQVKKAPLSALQADTTSGDVTLLSGSEKTLVETSSGDLRLDHLGGELSVDTSSGDVHADWDRLAAGQKVRVHTSSGDVRLRVPAGGQVTGEVTTASGRIVSDFPGASDRREHRLTFPGADNAFGLDVHTSSGDVTLRQVARAPAEAEPHK